MFFCIFLYLLYAGGADVFWGGGPGSLLGKKQMVRQGARGRGGATPRGGAGPRPRGGGALRFLRLFPIKGGGGGGTLGRKGRDLR